MDRQTKECFDELYKKAKLKTPWEKKAAQREKDRKAKPKPEDEE